MSDRDIIYLHGKIKRLSARVAKLEARTYAAWGPSPPTTWSLASGQLASSGEATCAEWCGLTLDDDPRDLEWDGFHIMNCGVSYCREECYQAGRSTGTKPSANEPPAEQPSRQETGRCCRRRCRCRTRIDADARCEACEEAECFTRRGEKCNVPAEPPAPAPGTLAQRIRERCRFYTDDIRRGWTALADDVAVLEARLAQAERLLAVNEKVLRGFEERCKEADDRVKRQTDWYQQRFDRLRKWVNDEVRQLSADVATRYFSICANGSPAPHESADWTNTMHALRMQLAQAERDKASATQSLVDEYDRRKQAERERDAYRADLNAEMDGKLELRARHGARENETWAMFIERMRKERDEAVPWERARCLGWVENCDLTYGARWNDIGDGIRSGEPAPGTDNG